MGLHQRTDPSNLNGVYARGWANGGDCWAEASPGLLPLPSRQTGLEWAMVARLHKLKLTAGLNTLALNGVLHIYTFLSVRMVLSWRVGIEPFGFVHSLTSEHPKARRPNMKSILMYWCVHVLDKMPAFVHRHLPLGIFESELQCALPFVLQR